jgi:hypothetical protein
MGRIYKELFPFANIVKMQVDAADQNVMELVVTMKDGKQGFILSYYLCFD